MRELRIRALSLVSTFALLLLSAACSPSGPSATPTASTRGAEQETETASYRVEVKIGPVVALMAGQSEIMGQALPMSMIDQGQPVNHHLEIHVYKKSSGAELVDVIPTVRFTNKTTGASRTISNVRVCLPPNDHGAGPHFGDNHFLPDGKYTFTIGVGDETAVSQVSVGSGP